MRSTVTCELVIRTALLCLACCAGACDCDRYFWQAVRMTVNEHKFYPYKQGTIIVYFVVIEGAVGHFAEASMFLSYPLFLLRLNVRCASLKVGRYPSLFALNWPDAPTRTAAEPAAKLIKTGGGSADDILGLIRDIFSPMAAGSVVARELESRIGAEVGEAGGSRGGGGAACVRRVEDAAVSVRWILTYDVFTQGWQLSKERMGE